MGSVRVGYSGWEKEWTMWGWGILALRSGRKGEGGAFWY